MKLYATMILTDGAIYTPFMRDLLGLYPDQVAHKKYALDREVETKEEFVQLLTDLVNSVTELPARPVEGSTGFTVTMLELSTRPVPADRDAENFYSLKSFSVRDDLETVEAYKAWELPQLPALGESWETTRQALEAQTLHLMIAINQPAEVRAL